MRMIQSHTCHVGKIISNKEQAILDNNTQYYGGGGVSDLMTRKVWCDRKLKYLTGLACQYLGSCNIEVQ